jgi:nucleoside-diphosphate-sugar epimerase
MEIDNPLNQLLVVGGTGFIGQHVVKKAIEQGFNITVLSKNAFNITNRLKGVNYLSADIGNKADLLAKLKGRVFDYVVNLGGYVDHSSYSNGGSKVYNSHFNGVKNLVECFDKTNIRAFVQIGSSDEYGNNSAPQHETQREDPISPYSCAKVASTYFLQTLYKTENFPAVILRPFLVYGPGQSEDRLIPHIIKGCGSDVEFSVSGGDQNRDFCYIDDFVRAIFMSFHNKRAYGEVINISSGIQITVKDVINKIIKIVGSGNPKFGGIPYKSFENMDLYADISKAKLLIQWSPEFNIDEGLRKTINFYNEK